MSFIKNLLAIIGLIAVAGGGWFYHKMDQEMGKFDPGAKEVYLQMMQDLLETHNAAEATVWKVPVEPGLSAEDVEESMKMVANELNFSNVGELPLYKDVEAKTGEPYRFVKFYLFCDSLIAKQMLDYSDAFSAYMPCRISMVEDQEGKLWLYTLNMDMMIHGGEPLEPELKKSAIEVREKMLEIMHRGAKGDF
ncbi:MAG: DUF302 domain-containing protein [Gammaproteobacteria bacterium]|nr:DUF302 domain-containing protein [Gammaproteobacteria bacterium]